MPIPTKLDRYPAKMVSKLADQLVERYALSAQRVLDPFCGSGAVLWAAHKRGISVSGVDLNPLAQILSMVKLNGFSKPKALDYAQSLISLAQTTDDILPIEWPAKHYWFTSAVINKFERLRAASVNLKLKDNSDGRAVLLSLAMSVRLCSRADQRSPKPFISKQALEARKGRHFDPYKILFDVLNDLCDIYGNSHNDIKSKFILADITSDINIKDRIGKHSHVITSPPYINAQDYFRNSKLELYVLEGLLPFKVKDIQNRFIGSERGYPLCGISKKTIEKNYALLPGLQTLANGSPRLAAVVHRYIHNMGRAFDIIKTCLNDEASFILVCGDNLIGGIHIKTHALLRQMLEQRGFVLFDQFSDTIENRMLPPKRSGHKGLIKEEIVAAFRMIA